MCTTKNLGFKRELYASVRNRELRDNTVRMVNLLDPRQTLLPQLSVAEYMGITLGPASYDSFHGYMTEYHEQDVLAIQQANYQDPVSYHTSAAQVCTPYILCYITTKKEVAEL